MDHNLSVMASEIHDRIMFGLTCIGACDMLSLHRYHSDA